MMSRYRFAVLGDPVDHSRSPQLHGAMLELAGLEGEYLKIRADETVLRNTIEELRSGEWDGLNVTMPLKAAAANASDSVAMHAVRSGSVNTLVRSDGDVVGYSTDTSTFHYLVTSDRFGEVSSIHLLGAGGTAAAALAAFGDIAPVYLASRRVEQAEDLTDRLGGELIAWGAAVAGALLINTTPLGMGREPLPAGILDVASGLIDLPYGERTTPAIAAARTLGIPVADGHEFLLRQAMESFTIWTGSEIEFEELFSVLRKA